MLLMLIEAAYDALTIVNAVIVVAATSVSFLILSPVCGKNTVMTWQTTPRFAIFATGGEVVAGRGSWPWIASLGRFELMHK